jgi:hypothetical protein
MGHNQGTSMERGQRMRAFQWQKAREAAMPKAMPLMVVKMHVRRAHALGLDYPTYAAVRKASGRDIMGLLFSSNALRIMQDGAPQMPKYRAQVVAAVKGAKRLALVHAPLSPDEVTRANPALDAVARAPIFTNTWSDMRRHLSENIVDQNLLPDQVLIIGDTAFERDWAGASRAAGYLDAARYFTP